MPRPHYNEQPINTPLLDHLLTHADFHTIEALAQAVSQPIADVLCDLGQLRAIGCFVHEHPQHGIRLVQTAPAAWTAYLRWRDRGAERPIKLYQTVTSTQDVTRSFIESRGPAADGAVVIADHQTAGRGRLGRMWLAPAGSAVLFSRACVVQPATEPPSTDRLMLATAVAIAETIETVTAPHCLETRIRWPNDIMLEGRKLAGILVERFMLTAKSGTTAAIIGVGINVSGRLQDLEDRPEKSEARTPDRGGGLGHTATSLELAGQSVDRLTVLAAAIEHLDATLAEKDIDTLVERWRERSTLLGRRATFYCDGRPVTGRIIDVDPCNGLIVGTDTGSVVHLSGATTTIKGER